MSDYKTELLKLRSTCKVDKDLKLKEQENEIKYLKAQITKLKKQSMSDSDKKELQKFRSSTTNPHFLKKYANRQVSEALAKQVGKTKYYRNLQHQNNLQLKFLEKRIKKVLGPKTYLELVNCVDNPDYGKIVKNPEKFIEKNKRLHGE